MRGAQSRRPSVVSHAVRLPNIPELDCRHYDTGVPARFGLTPTGQCKAAMGSIGSGSGRDGAPKADHRSRFELSSPRCEASAPKAGERGPSGSREAVKIADPHRRALRSMARPRPSAPVLLPFMELRALGPAVALIAEYVGPTRLQWTKEVDYGRRFLEANEVVLHVSSKQLRYKTPIDRLRQIWRDHSEAPQSDRIMPSLQSTAGRR